MKVNHQLLGLIVAMMLLGLGASNGQLPGGNHAPRTSAKKSATQMIILPTAKLNLRGHITVNGAIIEIARKEPKDVQTLNAIKSFGEVLAALTISESLTNLFEVLPPDLDFIAFAREHRGINFTVSPMEEGIAINLIATGQESRTAIHRFMRTEALQRALLLEGDSRKMDHPGNNLGWDAPPSPDLDK